MHVFRLTEVEIEVGIDEDELVVEFLLGFNESDTYHRRISAYVSLQVHIHHHTL